MDDKTKILYDALSQEYDLGTLDEFSVKLQDSTKRRSFYDSVSSSYDLGSYEDFEGKVVKKKDASQYYLSEDFAEKYAPEAAEEIKEKKKKETTEYAPVEKLEDLSLGQRKQVLQSEYKKRGVDWDAITPEETTPKDYSPKAIMEAGLKKDAYENKQMFENAEKFQEDAENIFKELQERAKEGEDVKKLQSEYEKQIESLEKEYDKKALSPVDTKQEYPILGDEKDEYGKLFKNIIESNNDHVIKEQQIEALKDSILSGVSGEAKEDVEGEINRLIYEISGQSPLGEQLILKRGAKETKRQLDDAILRLSDEINKKAKEKGIDLETQITTPEFLIEESNKLSKMQSASDMLKRALNVPESKQGAGAVAFSEEFGNILSVGLAGLFEDIGINQSLNRQKKGEATEADNALIDAHAQYRQLSSMASKGVNRYRRMKSLAGSIPYVEQFLVTGGIGDIATATGRKATASILKKRALRSIKGMGGITKRVVKPTVESAVSLGGRLPLSPATYERVLEQREVYKYEDGKFVLDEENMPKISEAIAKGVWLNAADIFSENMGGVFALPAWKGAKRVITPSVRKLFARAGLHNPFGEYGEEIIAALLQKEKIDKEFLKDLLVVIPMMTGGFLVASSPAMVGDYKMERKKEFEKKDRAELQELIDNKDEEGLTNKVAQMIEGKSEQETLDIMETVGGMVQDDVTGEITEKAKEEKPTVKETVTVQKEEVKAQPEKAKEEVRVEPEKIAEELNVRYEGIQDMAEQGKWETYTITEEGPAQDATFNVKEGSTLEQVQEKKQETIDKFKPKEKEYEKAEEGVQEAPKEKVKPEEVTTEQIYKKKPSKALKGLGEEITQETILVRGKKAGKVDTGKFGNDIRMNNIQVDEDMRRQGAGIEVYRQLNERAAKEGGILFSSETVSPEAKGLWEKLISTGEAVKEGDVYKFKPKEKEIKKSFGDVVRDVVEKSESPEEVYNIYKQAKEVYSKERTPWQEDLLKMKVAKSSLAEFGDPNKFGMAMMRNWVAKKDPITGKWKNHEYLDVIAQQLSETHNKEITPDMVAEFIMSNPSKTKTKAKHPNLKALEDKFKEISGQSVASYEKEEADFVKKIEASDVDFKKIIDILAEKEDIELLTVEDYENIKDDYFTGFPFTPEEGEVVKRYLDEKARKGKGRPEVEGARKEGEGVVEEEPTKEIAKRKEAAKGLIAEGLNDLANLTGKKELIGEERVSAIRAIEKIAKGIVEGGIAEIDAIIEKVKQLLKDKNISIPDDVIEEGVKNVKIEPIEKQEPIISPEEGKPTKEEKEAVKRAEKAPKEGKEKRPLSLDSHLANEESIQQKLIADVARQRKNTYEAEGGEEIAQRAIKEVLDMGVDGATYEVIKPTKNLQDLPLRTVMRQVLMDYYSRIMASGRTSAVEKEAAFRKTDDIMDIYVREITPSAKVLAYTNIWKVMQPEGVLYFVRKKIKMLNEAKLDKPVIKGEKKTIGEQLDESMDRIDKETKRLVGDAIDEIIKTKGKTFKITVVKPRRPAPMRSVPAEQIRQSEERIKRLKEQHKIDKKAGLMSATIIPGLTVLDVEFFGNVLAEYVKMGYYTVQDLINRLKSDAKDIDVDLTDEQAGALLDTNYKDGLTFRQYAERETEQRSIIEDINQMQSAIAKVIRRHWTDVDEGSEVNPEINRPLWLKLKEDVGLTEEEAKRIEKMFLDTFKDKIEGVAREEVGKILGLKGLPKKAKHKTKVQKIIDAVSRGALGTQMGREIFADMLGLAKAPDTKQAQEIIKLSRILQGVSGKGWIERDASIRLGKYIYELFPHSMAAQIADDFIALAYANMLSGVSTSVLNLVSAMSNIWISPVRTLGNLSLWTHKIKEAKRKGTKVDWYNPVSFMAAIPMLKGMLSGAAIAKEVYLHGDVQNKYIEDVKEKIGMARITPLERDKYGRAKRFKPLYIKIGNKKYDLNIFNYAKLSGRNLSAQDKFMLHTSYHIELVRILRDYVSEAEGLTGRALTKRVMELYRTTHYNNGEIIAQMEARGLTGRVLKRAVGREGHKQYKARLTELVETEAEEYYRLSGIKMTNLQKRIRRRELELENIPFLNKEDRAKTEELARSNIFTDERGGIFGNLASGLGTLSNVNRPMALALKPFIPFTRIIGNVAEYALDHAPFLGFVRANVPWFNITIKGKTIYKSPSMGERGSRAYYEQMGRAWFGTQAFVAALMFGLDSDEDDFFQITGGYRAEGYTKAGREKLAPKYSMIFRWTDKKGKNHQIEIPYLYIPSIAVPVGIIGNLNDELRLNKDISKERLEDLHERFTVAMLLAASGQTATMVKDMSFVDGIKRFFDLAQELLEIGAGAENDTSAVITARENMGHGAERLGKMIGKSYFKFATTVLPWNNNFVRQVEKFFDPTSYSQKEIRGILGYSMGLQLFINYPNIDQLGDVCKTYPGETLLPYTHWLNIVEADERWQFLIRHNYMPNKLHNVPMNIETKDGLEHRTLEEKEFYDYTLLMGEKFSDRLKEYMKDEEMVKKRMEDKEEVGEEIWTGVQKDVHALRKGAMEEAKTELFRWGQVKDPDPQGEDYKLLKDAWEVIKENKAYFPYSGSGVKVGKYTLNKSELFEFNERVTVEYAKLFMKMYNRKSSDTLKRWKEKVEIEETGKTRWDFEIGALWTEAKAEVKDKMFKELKALGKEVE